MNKKHSIIKEESYLKKESNSKISDLGLAERKLEAETPHFNQVQGSFTDKFRKIHPKKDKLTYLNPEQATTNSDIKLTVNSTKLMVTPREDTEKKSLLKGILKKSNKLAPDFLEMSIYSGNMNRRNLMDKIERDERKKLKSSRRGSMRSRASRKRVPVIRFNEHVEIFEVENWSKYNRDGDDSQNMGWCQRFCKKFSTA